MAITAALAALLVASVPVQADHLAGERLFLCCSSSDIPRWFPGNTPFHVHHGWTADDAVDDPRTRFDLYIDGVKQVGIEERPAGGKIHGYTFPTGLAGRHVVRGEWWERDSLELVVQRTVLFAVCVGHPATLVGTGKGELLLGTGGRDVVVALGGDDVIRTFRGADVVCAGAGDDRVIGGGGADLMLGQGGADTLLGGFGGDQLRGNRGPDDLRGGPGTDICRGGPGDDTTVGCELGSP